MTWQEYFKDLFIHLTVNKENGQDSSPKTNSPNMSILSDKWFGLFPFSIKTMFRK